MTNFIGYKERAELPIKMGDTVTIRIGTPVKYRGEIIRAKKTYTVKVDHVLQGVTDSFNQAAQRKNTQNPSVRWAGSGGYWSEVDINLLPEAKTTCAWCENAPPTSIVECFPACEPCRKDLLE